MADRARPAWSNAPTTAAVLASERLERARDPPVREVLAKIAEDETRPAEFAWRTVIWAIERGGDSVYETAYAAFGKAIGSHFGANACRENDDGDEELGAHGRASAAKVRSVQPAVARDIAIPVAGMLATFVHRSTRCVDQNPTAVMN